MKTSLIALTLCASLFVIPSATAETIQDAISFTSGRGVVVPTLNAHFEGIVEAISIGTYDGKGTTTYPQLDAPKQIGTVKNGIMTINGTKFGLSGFVTDTTYSPDGKASIRYVGVSENSIISIFFSENFKNGYSIDFYQKGKLQPTRYNVRFPIIQESNKSEMATPKKPSD